jgi:uncharacterized protein YbjT (DUF2867 family)
MNVIVYGASGMVGQGVLLECVDHAEVESIVVVGRNSCGVTGPKIREVLQKDLLDVSAIRDDVAAADACFFCLGISSAGLNEAQYRAITYDIAVGVAQAFADINPNLTFIYVSGEGTGGKSMWARVKKETEDAILALGFRRAFMFRPGYIQPQRGIKSRTTSYRILYAIFGPLYPVWRALFPKMVTTTTVVGQAMIRVARDGWSQPVLHTKDINAAGEAK